ncbi:prolipoprotein diacylglyceryl transferase [candidate division WOR-3 bacterium]|nr:prolipoprotein diacylglyceryl transferase [candidate division WOR-3 bacterium]
MFRLLLDLGPFKIYSYGFLQFLAFLAGILLATKRAKKRGVDTNVVYDLAFWILVGGILGGRLWYVLEHFGYFRENFWEVLQVWHGGMVIYGGLFLGFLTGFIYIKKNKLGFLKIADIVSPSITLGLFIGRIGCFMNGCCYGVESDRFGILFHDYSNCNLIPDAPVGTKVIPTQLIMSASALFLTFFLLLIDKRNKIVGAVFSWLMILYGVHRFSIDFLRHYEGSALIFRHLSLSQVFSLLLVLTGTVFLFFLNSKNKKTAP